MKRWGKDWSVYRTVKEMPVTIPSSSIKNLKKGNGWDQYINYTSPDKATLKRNLNAVRSSGIDDEGDEYDAFDAEHTRQEAILKVDMAQEAADAATTAAKGGPEATMKKRQADALKALNDEVSAKKLAEAAGKKAAKAGRPKYSAELLQLLADKKAEGKAQKKSARVIREEGIAFAKQYETAKKEAARKALIAKSTAKGGAAPPAAAVGGGGSAAAAAPVAEGDAAAAIDEVVEEAEDGPLTKEQIKQIFADKGITTLKELKEVMDKLRYEEIAEFAEAIGFDVVNDKGEPLGIVVLLNKMEGRLNRVFR